MKRWIYLTGFLIIVKRPNAFLNEAEEKISTSLMEDLSIDHRIILQEPNFQTINLQIFKRPWNKPTVYQNTNQILKYFRKKTFPKVPTLIICKVGELTTMAKLLKTLTKTRKSHMIARFSWLVFMDSHKANKEIENELLIPFNCEFIISYPINSTSYKLVEIYKIKKETATNEFGIWNEGKLDITKTTWYRRKKDFKNETLVMGGVKFYGGVGECHNPRHCAYLLYVETLSTDLNFSINWIKRETANDLYFSNNDFFDAPYDSFLHTGFARDAVDVSNTIFTSQLNWFINEPKTGKRADYYIQPFTTKIWVCILITTIIGGLTASFLNYSFETESWRGYKLNHQFFVPIDCFFNQEGTAPGSKSSSRILCIFIRILALFIFGSYSATITSFSAFQESKAPFRNLEEFLQNGKYNVGFHKELDKILHEDSSDPLQRALKKKIVYYHNDADMINKICNENIAIVLPGSDIQTFRFPCTIKQIENPLSTLWIFTAIKKNSQYKKMFDHFLINFYSSGIRQRTHQKALINPIGIAKGKKLAFDYVGFNQIVQVLAIYFVGVVSSVGILAAEILLSYFGRI